MIVIILIDINDRIISTIIIITLLILITIIIIIITTIVLLITIVFITIITTIYTNDYYYTIYNHDTIITAIYNDIVNIIATIVFEAAQTLEGLSEKGALLRGVVPSLDKYVCIHIY